MGPSLPRQIGHARPAPDPAAPLLAELQEQRNAIADLRGLLERQNQLTQALALQNAAVVLDLLQQTGYAQRRFFSATSTIAATATATVVDLDVPTGMVGFWRELQIEPDQSRTLALIMNIDGSPELRNTSVIATTLIPQSVWLPFYRNFQLVITNDDAAAPHNIEVVGIRIFLELDLWRAVQDRLQAGVGCLCGLDERR